MRKASSESRTGSSGAPGKGGSAGAEAITSDGEALFLDRCSACHGPTGEGTPIAPRIQEPVRGYAAYVVRHGRDEEFYSSTMDPFATDDLSDEQLDLIVDFLHTPERPADGAGLYGRFCANCHGQDALGGRSGKDLLEEVGEGAGEVLEAVREGHGGSNYGKRTSYMPAWSSSELSSAEVTKIVDYLTTLAPASPTGGGGDDDDDDKDDD